MRTTADDLKPEFVELRGEGWTYREIGAKYGYSYERIRQVLGPDSKKTSKRETKAVKISAWLNENGPTPRNRVCDLFDTTEAELGRMVRDDQVPAHLLLLPERSTANEFSVSEIRTALRRVWGALQASDTGATGLSRDVYEKYRGQDEPSGSVLISRFGWQAACEMAEVPHGGIRRPTSSYRSKWSDDELLGHVADYVRDAVADERRPTYLGYEAWQKGQLTSRPSGTLIRNRMRQHEPALARWADIVTEATQLSPRKLV